jgi:hypothetical protein
MKWYLPLIVFSAIGGLQKCGWHEMLVPVHHTTWCHIPEDSNLHNHGHENLSFHIKTIFRLLYPVFNYRQDSFMSVYLLFLS